MPFLVLLSPNLPWSIAVLLVLLLHSSLPPNKGPPPSLQILLCAVLPLHLRFPLLSHRFLLPVLGLFQFPPNPHSINPHPLPLLPHLLSTLLLLPILPA